MTEEEIKKKIEKLVEHADVHKKDETINAEELEWIQVFLIGMIKGAHFEIERKILSWSFPLLWQLR